MPSSVTMEEIALKYAELDGQIDWDSLPDLLKFEYINQVKMVMEAAAFVSGKQESVFDADSEEGKSNTPAPPGPSRRAPGTSPDYDWKMK